MKTCAARRVVGGPQAAVMRCNDGTADGQSQTGPVNLRGKKRIEDLVRLLRGQPYAGIADGDHKLLDAGLGARVHAAQTPRARKSKKRAPPHKMPRRLKTWLLRWQRIDRGVSDYVVHRHGQKITKLRRSWATARKRANTRTPTGRFLALFRWPKCSPSSRAARPAVDIRSFNEARQKENEPLSPQPSGSK